MWKFSQLTIVSKESNVDVVARREKPQRVAKKPRNEPFLTEENFVEY